MLRGNGLFLRPTVHYWVYLECTDVTRSDYSRFSSAHAVLSGRVQKTRRVLYKTQLLMQGKLRLSSGIKAKETPWPKSASELHRPKDHRLPAKLVPTFAGRGVSRSQRGRSPRPYSRISRPEQLLFLSSSSSVILTRLSGPCSRPTASHKIW
jgi:hypothetical protein